MIERLPFGVGKPPLVIYRCSARKANGNVCGAIANLRSRCPYHQKQENAQAAKEEAQ